MLIGAVIFCCSEQKVFISLIVAEAVWVFHSISTFGFSGPTRLVSSVYLKEAVIFCIVDLPSLPAKEMLCDFKRMYILPSCRGDMSINHVSPSVGINCRPSDLRKKIRRVVWFCSAFCLPLATNFSLKRHYCESVSIRDYFSVARI